MTIASLLKQPCTVFARGTVGSDEYRNDVAGDVSSYDSVCYLEQTATQEIVVDGQTVTSDWLLVLPAGSALAASAQVEVGGIAGRFEVVGEPARPFHARLGAEHHVEARLRKVTG